jgi:catechol 2,3-dioxygenase-like lactoylglutathione lyase family enzyme
VHHLDVLTLGVADLAASRRFYVDGLGWPVALDAPEIVFLQAGHGRLVGLWHRDELKADLGPSGPPGGGWAAGGAPPLSLGINVGSEAEVDAGMARAEAAGARIVKASQPAPFGGYSGYFADPDGFLWELVWNPGFSVDADGTVRLTPIEG